MLIIIILYLYQVCIFLHGASRGETTHAVSLVGNIHAWAANHAWIANTMVSAHQCPVATYSYTFTVGATVVFPS